MNPLFKQFGNNSMMSQFMQFKKTFSGDPRAQVEQLLNSGKVSQDQYNHAVQMANNLYKMMNT